MLNIAETMTESESDLEPNWLGNVNLRNTS